MTKELIKDIQWLIFDSGLDQKTIASKTDVSISTINRIKTGKQPIIALSARNLIKLYDFAVSIDP